VEVLRLAPPREHARGTTLAETVEAWRPEFLTLLHLGIANAGSEEHKPADQASETTRLRIPE
jgi:hypothetical protein